MRFLIVTTGRDPVTPDMGLAMVQMMQAWLAEHTASGKMEQAWSFAGTTGGGGILNVDSHEELDAIMGAFPFAQTSNVSVYPLADLDATLTDTAARMASILEMMQGQA